MKKNIFGLLLCLSSKSFSAYIPHSLLSLFSKKPTANLQVTAEVSLISIDDNFNYKATAKKLFDASKKDAIAGIVLQVDSTGGYVGDFSVIHDLIKKVTPIKPIVCLICSSALSGGYMIASAADYIIAHSHSSIGSIGSYRQITKYKNPKRTDSIEAELDVEFFSAGEYKVFDSPYTNPLSEKEKALIQSTVDSIYKDFCEIVAKHRKLDLSCYKEWAEAKIFYGQEALSLGLIDEIGTIFEAEKKILELIKLKNPTVCYTGTIVFTEEELKKEQE